MIRMVESDQSMNEDDEQTQYAMFLHEKNENILSQIRENKASLNPGTGATPLKDAERWADNFANYKDVDICGREFGPNQATLADADDCLERVKKITRNIRGEVGNPNFSFDDFTEDLLAFYDENENTRKKKTKEDFKSRKIDRRIIDPAEENVQPLAFWETVSNNLGTKTVLEKATHFRMLHFNFFQKFLIEDVRKPEIYIPDSSVLWGRIDFSETLDRKPDSCLFEVAKWAHDDEVRIWQFLANMAKTRPTYTQKSKKKTKKKKSRDLPEERDILDPSDSDSQEESSEKPVEEAPTQCSKYNDENSAFKSLIEQEQKRLLKELLRYFAETTDDEPLYYWECVISDDYAETIENIYNLSHILKEKVLKIWDSSHYDAVVMIPDYEAISHSKFGSQGRNKNISRLTYKRAKLEKTQLLEQLFEEELQKIKVNEESKHLDAVYFPGGSGNLCSWGHFNITISEWEEYVAHFRESRNKVGRIWEKFFKTSSDRQNQISQNKTGQKI